jgi:hypothetical protein
VRRPVDGQVCIAAGRRRHIHGTANGQRFQGRRQDTSYVSMLGTSIGIRSTYSCDACQDEGRCRRFF